MIRLVKYWIHQLIDIMENEKHFCFFPIYNDYNL